MKWFILLIMIFCHIVDDYYLQGWLASAKQKKWWEENAPNSLYKFDYVIALIEHAFSWSFMSQLPIMIYLIYNQMFEYTPMFLVLFIMNLAIHAFVDDWKANKLRINLIEDQISHIGQIVITWAIWSMVI